MKFTHISKNLSTFIFSLYLLILGITWICLHIYIRFFIERPAYTLEEIRNFITIKHYVIFSGFILLHLIIIMLCLLKIYKQRYPSQEESPFVWLSLKIAYILDITYWKPLEYVRDKLAPHIPMSGRLFIYIEKSWSDKDRTYFIILIFIFEILPKIILASTFLIEIIIFGQVKVFLYLISLILIPILWHIFLNLFAQFGMQNLPVVKNYFSEIKGINPQFDEQGTVISYEKYEFFVKQEYEDVIDIEEEVNLFMQLESMPRFVEQIKKDTDKLMLYITLITSLIYALGGIYRLLTIIL